MAEEAKSSVSSLKAMFEQNIQQQAAQPKPMPKKLQPSGVFGAQAEPAAQPKPAPAAAPKKTDASWIKKEDSPKAAANPFNANLKPAPAKTAAPVS